MTANRRPLPCTLSLDLDDAWTYMRAAGRDGWEDTKTVIPLVCERILTWLRDADVKFTLFVVAKDLEDDEKLAAIRPFVEEGHEIGCHSLNHEPTFATLDQATMRHEVLAANDLIEAKLGVRPVGFRAPGFAFSKLLPPILREGGFIYDGSFLPTFLGPVARSYYFFHSKMSQGREGQAQGDVRHVQGCVRSAPRTTP